METTISDLSRPHRSLPGPQDSPPQLLPVTANFANVASRGVAAPNGREAYSGRSVDRPCVQGERYECVVASVIGDAVRFRAQRRQEAEGQVHVGRVGVKF